MSQVAGALDGIRDVDAFREQHEVEVAVLNVKIVGIRYYVGEVHLGEYVNLVREPLNPYDANAIKVLNMSGAQVGHIQATAARTLCVIMDEPSRLCRLEGTITDPRRTQFDVPVQVTVFAVPAKASWVTALLRRGQLVQAPPPPAQVALAPGQYGGAAGYAGGAAAGYGRGYGGGAGRGAGAAAARPQPPAPPPFQPVAHVQVLDAVQTQKELDSLYAGQKQQLALLTFASSTRAPALATALLAHQQTGVAWMISREEAHNCLPPFYVARQEGGRIVFFNTVTNSSIEHRPTPTLGGILADDMGLGKTLQTVALILARPPPGVQYKVPVQAKEEEAAERASALAAAVKAEASAAQPSVKAEPAATAPAAVAEAEGAEAAQPARKKTKLQPLAADPPGLAPAQLDRLKVVKLKVLLQARGLQLTGAKKDLVERLRAAMLAAPDAAAAQPAPTPAPPPPAAAPPPPPPPPPAAAAAARGSGAAAARTRGTLIVAPASVLSNWEEQLSAHVLPGVLRVRVYHGQGRDADALDNADVVITTYGTLATEAKTAGGAPRAARSLVDGAWHRIVLDEAHCIRNTATKQHQACAAVSATHRWCLSGTPLQNTVEDLHALLAFLRLAPLNDRVVWRRAVAQPIKRGDVIGIARLRTLLSAVSIRREKGTLQAEGAFQLPPVRTERVTLALGPAAREGYTVLSESSRRCFELLYEAGGAAAVFGNYFGILDLILRLRQLCNSPQLVPPDRLTAARRMLQELDARLGVAAAGGVAPQPLSVAEATALLTRLRTALGEADDGSRSLECAVCLQDVGADMIRAVRSCKHAFCCACIDGLRAHSAGRAMHCPLCRAAFADSDVIELHSVEHAAALGPQQVKSSQGDEPAAGHAAAADAAADAAGASEEPCKVRALVDDLLATRARDPAIRSVVFSQFTSFLDLVGPKLRANGFSCSRIDGSMSVKQRCLAIRDLNRDGPTGVDVMLVSTKAGGVGLNLTRASQCYLLDMWWNSAVDQQAIDRIHRIGQTRPVRVVKYVCEDTIEQRIVALQEYKAGLSQGVLSSKAEDVQAVRLDALVRLLG